MKTIKHTLHCILALLLIMAALYQFMPKLYATAAYQAGLPVTERIKQANPDAWFDYQTKRLGHAATTLKEYRKKSTDNRSEINAQLLHYNEEQSRAALLLAEAKRIYQENPEAARLEFVGRSYSLSEFGSQVVVLNAQIKAFGDSVIELKKAQTLQENAWLQLAEKEATLEADRTRLVTARQIWRTQELLTDLEVTIDSAPLQEQESILRTVDELLIDVAKLPAAAPIVQGSGISVEALGILQGAVQTK